MIFKSSKLKDPESEKNKIERKIVQEWLPINDIHKYYAVTNETLIGVLQVQPININLKSLTETRSILKALTGAFNGLQDNIQILCISRPVDLDNYIHNTENRITNQINILKRKLLKQYLNYVRELVASGEATEERFYILLSEKKGKYAEIDLKKRLDFLQESFIDAGLNTSICNEKNIIDLAFIFSNSNIAAYERTNEFGLLYNITH